MYAPVLEPLQLPRGRHNLSRGAVVASQRQRLLTAVAEVFADRGYAGTTVSQVLRRARVSRRTFYEQFEGKDACLLAAYDEAEQRAWRLAEAAAAGSDDWPGRVGAALGAAIDFVAADPVAAHLFTLEARAATSAIAARHRATLDRLTTILQSGNRACRDSGDLPECTERVLLAQVVALVGSHVLDSTTAVLPGLAPQLAEHLLAPYRGEGEAAPRPISALAARGPR